MQAEYLVREFGDPPARVFEIVKLHQRFWWPHPYAREAGLLWFKLVVRYRYFLDGHEVRLR